MRAISLSAIASVSLIALMASSAQAALTISDKATENVTCSAGVCGATAKKAVLNVTDLANLIAASPVTIQSGSEAQDIVFDAPFSWTSSNGLTLDADKSITINKTVSDSGPAALTLGTGKKGELLFGDKGKIAFIATTNSLVINKQSYTLVDSVASLASAIANDPSGSYALAHNYDAGVDGTYSSSPIATTFEGKLEGLKNEISSLSVTDSTSSQDVGLFAKIDTVATVRDLKLIKLDVYSTGNQSGNENDAGGLAGENLGTLLNDFSSGHVKAKACGFICVAGGLVGINQGTIKDSRASVTAVCRNGDQCSVGGLVGFNFGYIYRSSANGLVKSNGFSGTGGLVGENEDNIAESYANTSVSCSGGSCLMGGLVGDQDEMSGTSIQNSYATGTLTGKTFYAGGLAGREYHGLISTSYAIGPIEAESDVGYAGGFTGGVENSSMNDADYWDTTTAVVKVGVGHGPSAGVYGLTDAQLKSGLPAGFDPKIWAHDPKINNGYPYLIDNPPEK